MIIKSRTARRVAIVGAAAALAGGFGMSSASAGVMSSGGGCTGYTSVGYGLSINSCISASSGTVFPDGYISGSASNCTIYVDLIKNGSVVSTRTGSCTSGHINGGPVSGGGTYFTGIYAVVNGNYTAEIISPNEYN
ncbi:hypothetical protein [Kitasatospora sp. CB01950]|uniref:hypothetical protein n=1 Tax=Kitasatospora sp. CB01950 TaxID=1703930 RepID=UPI0009393AAE|nr:hypothetical protein [Kitasatospora sp. CB01950]OKI99877.1 hypothetical protein AMK19_30585 [Kitasatospora sp. CB01950]